MSATLRVPGIPYLLHVQLHRVSHITCDDGRVLQCGRLRIR